MCSTFYSQSSEVQNWRLCARSQWHSVATVDFYRGSYWTPGVDTGPATETWDPYGDRCDGEPYLAELRLGVHPCPCVCVCVWGWGGRKRTLRGILTHYGGVVGWGCDMVEYIIACPLVSSHQRYNRWNWFSVSMVLWHFTFWAVQLSSLCSQECLMQHCRQKKSWNESC